MAKKWSFSKYHFWGRRFTSNEDSVINEVMKIQPALIVLFILSLIVTAVMETAAYRLYREYHSRFLLSYFLLLTAWNTFGIFGYILSVLAPFLLPADAGSTISLLFGFLILPVLFVKLYFFTDFIVRLLEKEVHRFFKVGFGLFVFVVLGILLLGISGVLPQPGAPSSFFRFPILRIIKGVFIYGSLVYLFVKIKSLSSTVKRRHFTGIGVVFAVGYTLSEVGMMGYSPVNGLLWSNVYVVVTFFGTPVSVYLILRRYLHLYYASRPVPREQTETDFPTFFETYEISQREGEVIRLILKGHSNREIEEELFISLETVKKHIYNIYKKTGVKNRVQLNYLVWNFNNGRS
jgi:DNA-binding CsgD family transcriptional regulator